MLGPTAVRGRESTTRHIRRQSGLLHPTMGAVLVFYGRDSFSPFPLYLERHGVLAIFFKPKTRTQYFRHAM